MITRNGRIKRTELSAFANVRANGLIALGIDDDDELGWVYAETVNVASKTKAARSLSHQLFARRVSTFFGNKLSK